MFLYEGFQCPVCGKAFEKSDDIVVCPTCGAPHHRECYKQVGHCYFEHTHGTPDQWTRDRAQTTNQQQDEPAAAEGTKQCIHCGHPNSVYAEFCAGCGKDLDAAEWTSTVDEQQRSAQRPHAGYREYRPFQAPMPDVGAPDDTDLDGISAKEVRAFTGQNSHYYVTKYEKLCKKRGNFSWNWAAFLLTPYWLWYRKQYIAASLVLFFEGIYSIFVSFFLYGYLQVESITDREVLFGRLGYLHASDSNFWRWVIILYLFLFLSVLIRFFFGAFGNYLYYRFSKKRILKTRNQANMHALTAMGGTSTLLAIASYVLLYVISNVSNFIF